MAPLIRGLVWKTPSAFNRYAWPDLPMRTFSTSERKASVLMVARRIHF
jgi:hypothetical protein